MHEMGHVYGLQHENRNFNIMGRHTNFVSRNGSKLLYTPGADAILGLGEELTDRYFEDFYADDLSVSSFKHTGEIVHGDQLPYSEHGHVVIQNAIGECESEFKIHLENLTCIVA